MITLPTSEPELLKLFMLASAAMVPFVLRLALIPPTSVASATSVLSVTILTSAPIARLTLQTPTTRLIL